MPIVNGYLTLADVKSRLRIALTTDDALLSALIEAASRAIDDVTGRRFWLSPSPEVRYYPARLDDRYLSVLTNPFLERKAWSKYPIDIMDCVSVTDVSTNESGDRVTWTPWVATQDYYLEPINGAVDRKPFNRIRADPINGRYWFPPWPMGTRVTGIFGYAFDYDGTGTPQAPLAIREACFLLCNRLYKRKDAPFGVVEAGAVEKMAIRLKEDADIAALIDPYRYNVGETSLNWVLL